LCTQTDDCREAEETVKVFECVYLAQWKREPRKHFDHLNLLGAQIGIETDNFNASRNIWIVDGMIVVQVCTLDHIVLASSFVREKYAPQAGCLYRVILFGNRFFVVAIEPPARGYFDVGSEQ
jgi:hypothetical protein